MVQPVRLDPLKNPPPITDDAKYLQPGFDPQTLTIPELRRIFVFHEISHASNLRKKSLVSLFRAEIEPRASVTLAASAKVEPSTAGIIDA
ncbi:hypothetical protein LY78DRAFT_579969 [Colletotrichum sublineola]|nr:hypothetical protein LY78DRAFT_579969 [Colletotrichum sublineola]